MQEREQRVKRRSADEWGSRHPHRRVGDLSGRHRNSVCVGEKRKRKWASRLAATDALV